MNFVYILISLWVNINSHDSKIAPLNSASSLCSPDYEALKAIYRAANGDSWIHTWDTTDCNVCNWYGVTCANNRVTQLLIGDNNLTGTISPQIGSLPFLTYINFRGNHLTGAIPREIGQLSNLEYLYIDISNQLSGTLPLELGNLSNLKIIALSGNPLTGDLTSLGSLTNLIAIFLGDNLFTGSIPSSFGNFSNLQFLGLGNCNLTGNIPSELGNLSNLHTLYIDNNQLTGSIPEQLGNLSSLQTLYLSNNQLTGCFPANLNNLCSHLNTYDFSNNPGLPGGGDFASFCSNGVGDCSNPACSPDYEALKAIYRSTNGALWTNQWDTTDCDLTHWYGVILDQNNIRVNHLQLGGNGLTGNIAPEIGNLTELFSLEFLYNELTGIIPDEIGNLTHLEFLHLSNNEFTGNIPTSLSNIISLRALNLKNNQLSGSIPAQLGNLVNLQYLELENNQLTGGIPAELGNLNTLTFLSLNNNLLSGCFPVELTGLCDNGSGPFGIQYNLSNNPGLPGGGDFASFCANGSGACSSCSGDIDLDGVCDDTDNCTLYNPAQLDSDCDGVGDTCDICPGGNDKIDRNRDGKPDCAFPPAYTFLPASWKCGTNKVLVCEIDLANNQSNVCINKNSLAAKV